MKLRKRNVKIGNDQNTPVDVDHVQKFVRTVKKLDMYPKLDEDHVVHTKTGGTVFLVCFVIILYLYASECRDYFTITTTEHIVVDTSKRHKMQINLNITFYHLPCKATEFNVMDSAGEQFFVFDHIYKVPLDPDGKWLTSPVKNRMNLPAMMPETEEHKTLKNAVGCMVWGEITVNKVAGNLHVALGKGQTFREKHIHRFSVGDAKKFNMSHKIEYFSFGESYPERTNPLDNMIHIDYSESKDGKLRVLPHFAYYVKIVPTVFQDINGNLIRSSQYSITEQTKTIDLNSKEGRSAGRIPGLFFIYDISPFVVKIIKTRPSLSHFLTSVCAIIGGVFTISGVIDSLLYHGNNAINSLKASSLKDKTKQGIEMN